MFEWDDEKNRSNLAKHGISFEDAMKLWQDDYSQELKSKNEEEEIMRRNIMKTSLLDKKFDDNQEDILNDFEPIEKVKRVNVDFPSNVLNDLDKIAKAIGITRQSLLKMWVYKNIQEEKDKNKSA